jgi:hypothetical protein
MIHWHPLAFKMYGDDIVRTWQNRIYFKCMTNLTAVLVVLQLCTRWVCGPLYVSSVRLTGPYAWNMHYFSICAQRSGSHLLLRLSVKNEKYSCRWTYLLHRAFWPRQKIQNFDQLHQNFVHAIKYNMEYQRPRTGGNRQSKGKMIGEKCFER